MCIAWPMRLIEILPDNHAMADLDGVMRRISLRLLENPQVGDYVLVHAGYAIEKVDPLKADEQLRIMQELKNGIIRED
ncbi:MAG: HypC/HybG/HupF family hydrogenase formation chaperone [Lentisphaerae bacterium]|nr:HypC/HybG/HupF family hydrogenase formation chaperone [Lentisphaerota bacterium]